MAKAEQDAERFELTTTLAVEPNDDPARADLPRFLPEFAEHFDAILGASLRNHPAVTAYFVRPGEEASEIVVGLRFEGMPPANIEAAAAHILNEALEKSTGADHTTVREESTLVPA